MEARAGTDVVIDVTASTAPVDLVDSSPKHRSGYLTRGSRYDSPPVSPPS